MHLLLQWLILSLAVWVTAKLVPGIRVGGFSDAIVVAAIFGLLNFAIGWFLFVMLGIATLGTGFLLAFITRMVVTAILLMLTDKLTDRLSVQGFGSAFLGALCISASALALDVLFHSHA